jgi:hypothetical protein
VTVVDTVHAELAGPFGATDAPGDMLRVLLEAVLGPAVEAQPFIEDPRGALTALVLPEEAPVWALRFAANVHGVTIPAGITEAETRALLRDRPARRRGTARAMRAAIATTLTGTRRVRLVLRHDPATPGVDAPYDITVVTREIETPDPAATVAAAWASAPRGRFVHHEVSTGPTWDEMTGTWDDQTGTWDSKETYT